MSPEDLRKVIQDRLEFLDKSVGEDIEIVFEPSADSIMVVCNTNLLMQAITNLILNSKEAYPKGTGKIVISLDTEEIPDEISEVHMGARPGMFARLRVKDFGLGMSPETLSKAFDPLFTTKSSSGHTGLGLSIVFAIIRSHDGFLTAESHPEKGTTVTLYIPVAAADVLHPNTSASQSAKASTTLTMGNGEKILLVEDEPGVREMVSMMLSALNYSVISCCNGSEAVEKAQSEKFAVVITDLLLPKMGGSEVVTRIREASPVTKAIIMTGYGSSGDSNDSSTKVLSKPFDVETLSEAVREALVS